MRPPHDMRLPVHLELVERLLSATATALLVRARIRGAVPRGIAHVSVRHGRFVAEVDFEAPIGPEKQDGLALMLTVLPDQRAELPAHDAGDRREAAAL